MAVDITKFGTAGYDKDYLGNTYRQPRPLSSVLNYDAVSFIIKRGVSQFITKPLMAQCGNTVYNMSDEDCRKLSVTTMSRRSDLLQNARNPSSISVSGIVVIDATKCSDKVKNRLWLWSINSLLFVRHGSGKYQGLMLVSRSSTDYGVISAALATNDEDESPVDITEQDVLEMQIKKTKQQLAELEFKLDGIKKNNAARQIIRRAQEELDELYGSNWSELCGDGWKLTIKRAE